MMFERKLSNFFRNFIDITGFHNFYVKTFINKMKGLSFFYFSCKLRISGYLVCYIYIKPNDINSSFSEKASLYVNAQLVNSTTGNGTLSQDWGSQGEIGSTLPEYDFNGFVDEFYIFTKALTKEDILVLVQSCTYG